MISCGEKHTAVLTVQGHLYTMGSNLRGQLGLGEHLVKVGSPTLVESLSRVIQVACGNDFSVAICINSIEKNEVYSWGGNKYG